MKILFIGGYPKGHDRPFHPETLSGKRLRQLANDLKLDAVYLDLWQTAEEEKRGLVDQVSLSIIKNHLSQGTKCIALGRTVQTALLRCEVEAEYLPHPASRRHEDRKTLENRLKNLALNKI